jgi:hypothetical protein
MGLMHDVSNIEGGIRTGIGYDEGDDNIVIRSEQDCQPTIELNKKLMNDGTGGYGPTREWRRVASIPNIILEKWLKEEGIRYWDSEDTHKLAAKLDDPEWAFLRTAPGKVSRKPIRNWCRASTSRLRMR